MTNRHEHPHIVRLVNCLFLQVKHLIRWFKVWSVEYLKCRARMNPNSALLASCATNPSSQKTDNVEKASIGFYHHQQIYSKCVSTSAYNCSHPESPVLTAVMPIVWFPVGNNRYNISRYRGSGHHLNCHLSINPLCAHLFLKNRKYKSAFLITSHLWNSTGGQNYFLKWPLSLTWFNFNPSMYK